MCMCVCVRVQMFGGPSARAIPLLTLWFTLHGCVVRVGQASVSPGQCGTPALLFLRLTLSVFLFLGRLIVAFIFTLSTIELSHNDAVGQQP